MCFVFFFVVVVVVVRPLLLRVRLNWPGLWVLMVAYGSLAVHCALDLFSWKTSEVIG